MFNTAIIKDVTLDITRFHLTFLYFIIVLIEIYFFKGIKLKDSSFLQFLASEVPQYTLLTKFKGSEIFRKFFCNLQ